MAHPIDKIRELFKLTPEEEEVLLSGMVEQSFRRGERIETRNLIRSYGYYVQCGMVRVFYMSNGREHTFSFALEDEYISPSHLLLNSPDSVMCIEFLEPTKVIMISHRFLGERLEEILPRRAREVLTFIASSMMAHVKYLEERVMLLQTASAPERYRWMEKRYPRVIERATMTQVASFLGITKETLYRIRSNKYKNK